MMLNKILLTSVAVAGLAVSATNSQLNNSKKATATTDKVAKLSTNVSASDVKSAVSSVNNVKAMQLSATTPATDASADDSSQADAQSSADSSSSASQSSDSSSSQAATVQVQQVSTPVRTTTASGDIQWLINQESGGNVNATNGGFYGIGQLSQSAYAQYAGGQDYVGNYDVQLQAMQSYIADRYGSVGNAISHFQSNGWY
ncbi:peptidoglycan-binding protein [Leuconostocaceae bacterium ESL0723]|nr:peptidoglycan-binding protein [Leuconostocaceae bacterium ESL0723]